MMTTRPPKTIVKPTTLGPVANTDTKLLIYGLFQKGRVLAQGRDDPVLYQNSALLKDHGCNLMHRKVLASFYQHLMAEAPLRQERLP